MISFKISTLHLNVELFYTISHKAWFCTIYEHNDVDADDFDDR